MLDKDKLYIIVHLGVKNISAFDVAFYIDEVTYHILKDFDESVKVLVLPTMEQSNITLEFFNASAMKYETAEEFTAVMNRLETLRSEIRNK